MEIRSIDKLENEVQLQDLVREYLDHEISELRSISTSIIWFLVPLIISTNTFLRPEDCTFRLTAAAICKVAYS